MRLKEELTKLKQHFMNEVLSLPDQMLPNPPFQEFNCRNKLLPQVLHVLDLVIPLLQQHTQCRILKLLCLPQLRVANPRLHW